MAVDYTPSFDPADVDSDYGSTGGDITVPTFTANMKPFRYWCQRAVPLVYDDSLSYYEVLCKVVDQLNGFLTDLQTATGAIDDFAQQFVINQQFLNNMADQLGQNVEDLETYINNRMDDFTAAYTQLQTYVNNYFDNLDVQQEINNKLDAMAANGTFNTLFDPVITAWMTAKTAQIDQDLSNQNQTIANQNNRISVLEGRMDTFASLPAGSTSGNAELLDIRTNFLGETFGSAGDAVRVSDLLASGFSSQPIIFDWIGETLGFGYFDTTRYKGGKIAFIVNTAYNGITEYGRLYIGNTATEISPTIRLYPDSDTDPDHAHVSDYLAEYQEKILTSNENGTRFLVTFSIPSTFTYLYIGTSVSRGNSSTGLPQPDFIVYASNWLKTTVDSTLTQPGEAADAKATGDAVSSLSGRLDDLAYLTTAESTQNSFDPNNGYANIMRYYENGTEYANQNYYTTPYIEIDPISSYKITSTNAHICLWDSSKTFLRGYLISNTATITVESEGASYLSVSVPNNAKNTTTIFSIVPVFTNDIDKLNRFTESFAGDIKENLAVRSTFTSGYIFYYENGTRYENANYSTSDYIPCESDAEYGYSLLNSHLCLWDENKNFIKGILISTQNTSGTVNTENAKFITISSPNNDLDFVRLGVIVPTTGKAVYQRGEIHFTIPVNGYNITQTDSASNYADGEAIQDVPAVIVLPTSYTATGKTVPLLMLCHGSGYAVSSNHWGNQGNNDSAFTAFVNRFVIAGYAVCDINGIGAGVQSTWGAPRAIQAYRKLYEYVTKNYNVQDKLNIYGFSMGGVVALNFASNNRDIVKCLAIAAPVTSLFDQVYNHSKGRKETLAAFYNFTLPSGFVFTDGPATEEELQIWNNNLGKMIGFNPTAKIVNINGEQIIPPSYPPLRVWHATNDASVNYIYSVNLVNAIRNGNSYASIRLMNSGGHGISYGESNVATTEFILWLNRFNQFA